MLENKPERTCGGCTLCCFTHEVSTDNGKLKDRNTWCKHCTEGQGCSIYDTGRPFACYDFRCAWLDGKGKEEDRPDKRGIVMQWKHTHLGRTLVMLGSEPLSLESPYAKRVITECAGCGYAVLLSHFDRPRQIVLKVGHGIEARKLRHVHRENIEIVLWSTSS